MAEKKLRQTEDCFGGREKSLNCGTAWTLKEKRLFKWKTGKKVLRTNSMEVPSLLGGVKNDDLVSRRKSSNS